MALLRISTLLQLGSSHQMNTTFLLAPLPPPPLLTSQRVTDEPCPGSYTKAVALCTLRQGLRVSVGFAHPDTTKQFPSFTHHRTSDLPKGLRPMGVLKAVILYTKGQRVTTVTTKLSPTSLNYFRYSLLETSEQPIYSDAKKLYSQFKH
ncbi:hypothetical protein NPIL_329891 [Nephila pilipes]|uniref:Uncharacterized protein n=1 Tax=Nephila pilipes TaxID=299642 RepID=A0A8X6N8Q5_NEPPI|nr:hypothetical protein NPIL_329891 [Nephila pilipes]